MKYAKSIFNVLLIALLFITFGCATSGSSSQKSTAPEDATLTLEDHLRRINGVRIMGNGDYAKVLIRGGGGISSVSRGMGEPESKKDINLGDSDERQPLFVVDGQKVGRNYPNVRDMFGPGDIASVELLSKSEASQYGSQGGSGVILIKTKAAQNNKEEEMEGKGEGEG